MRFEFWGDSCPAGAIRPWPPPIGVQIGVVCCLFGVGNRLRASGVHIHGNQGKRCRNPNPMSCCTTRTTKGSKLCCTGNFVGEKKKKRIRARTPRWKDTQHSRQSQHSPAEPHGITQTTHSTRNLLCSSAHTSTHTHVQRYSTRTETDDSENRRHSTHTFFFFAPPPCPPPCPPPLLLSLSASLLLLSGVAATSLVCDAHNNGTAAALRLQVPKSWRRRRGGVVSCGWRGEA